MVIVLCANLTGDGLRDVLDPGSRALRRGTQMSLLEVARPDRRVPTDTELVNAVRGMNFHVDAGEVVALVGESGSGKSACRYGDRRLLPEYAEVSGSIRLRDDELIGLSDNQMSQIRGKTIGTVFQDPMSALTPVYTVGDQVAEALEVHNRGIGERAARTRAVELLDLVGIASPNAGPGLPARTLRRRATACRDRDRDRQRSRPADLRRADHRARCHGAGADPRRPRDRARRHGRRRTDHHPRLGVVAEFATAPW